MTDPIDGSTRPHRAYPQSQQPQQPQPPQSPPPPPPVAYYPAVPYSYYYQPAPVHQPQPSGWPGPPYQHGPGYQQPQYPPAPQYQHEQYPPAGRCRRRRVTSWRAAVAVSVLALVAGATTAVVTYLDRPGPAAVVTSYFGALRDGDAPRALSFAPPPVGDSRFLTAKVLRAQSAVGAISAVTIGAVQHSGAHAQVAVSYTIGQGSAARSSTQSVQLTRRSRRWLLDRSAAAVGITVDTAHNRASLAGYTLPTGPVLLFPGALPVTYDSPLIEQDPTSDQVTLDSSGTAHVVAKLTAAAQNALTDSVKATMTACLKQGDQAPGSCPLTPRGDRPVPGSLRGELVDVKLSGDASLVPEDPDGLVTVQGSFDVNGTWTTLDFNNQPVSKSGTAVVPMSARIYVTAPTAVTWSRT